MWLAIDIGNTNTCAAIYDGDKNAVEVLVAKGRSKQLPSVVNFANLQDYSNPTVGQIPAKLQTSVNTIRDAKSRLAYNARQENT